MCELVDGDAVRSRQTSKARSIKKSQLAFNFRPSRRILLALAAWTMDAIQGNFAAESPHQIYSRLTQENKEKLTSQKRWDKGLGYAKLFLVLLAVFLMVRFVHELHGILPLLITIAVLAILAIVHARVLAQVQTLTGIIAFYERGLARLEDRWAGTGETGERFTDDLHPYSRDLDLFGKGSLFELLCTVRTRAGAETLASWLLEPAPPEEVLTRQAAVQELKSRTGFREELCTAGDRVRLGLHPEGLIAWGEQKSSSGSQIMALVATALAALWIAGLVYGLATGSFAALLLLSLINLSVNGFFRKRLAMSPEGVEAATSDLDLLAEVLRIFERERFSSKRLQHLQAALCANGISACAAVKKLDRITSFLAQHRNLMVGFIDGFVFYSVLLTLLAESWRKTFGSTIRVWLAAVGEMESIAALSCYAFEHPADAWPQLNEDSPCFHAEALAHPLLPIGKAVCNDLKLGAGLQLMILSGPNMSGKSTFVRGIGVNAVLAQCGGPVRAKRLQMSRLAIGASICVLDSLQGGVSRFYTEIRRLKLISDLAAGPIPVLFLLDELLSGTNSHDRLEGTKLVVGTLMQHQAIGLVTTHDLALAHIPENLSDAARNYHFEDHLEDGKLIFDFKLKPGVVQTSNALKLMESIGFTTKTDFSRE